MFVIGIRKKASFELGKEIEKFAFRLVTDSALRCSTTEQQRLYGERGPLLNSNTTSVLHTARISDVALKSRYSLLCDFLPILHLLDHNTLKRKRSYLDCRFPYKRNTIIQETNQRGNFHTESLKPSIPSQLSPLYEHDG